MDTKNISRRDALKIMGIGATGVAAATILSPVSQAKGILSSSFQIPPQGQGPQGGQPGGAPQGRMPAFKYPEKEVYSGPDVIIRQIDEHTWEGNGHLMSNETIYIIEGNDKAMLIDMGTKIEDLDKIVAGITPKPIIPVATHVHPDHTGSAINYFPELWINAADTVNVASMMGDYKGKINYLEDGQVFDLGGREIEVIFTPGHTPGSCTFFDKERRIGFSGDSFGSGNLLLTVNFSTLYHTASRIEEYMKKYGITKLYPGHYMGANPETLERITNLKNMSREMLDGTRQGQPNGQGMMGLNCIINDFGVRVSYKEGMGLK